MLSYRVAPCQSPSCFRRFKGSRSLEQEHERILDVVLARQAVAAHAISAVLSATNIAAVGRHSIGAIPQKPPALVVGSRHSHEPSAGARPMRAAIVSAAV